MSDIKTLKARIKQLEKDNKSWREFGKKLFKEFKLVFIIDGEEASDYYIQDYLRERIMDEIGRRKNAMKIIDNVCKAVERITDQKYADDEFRELMQGSHVDE